MEFQKYKNFQDFKLKTGMDQKDAIMFLLDEIEKKKGKTEVIKNDK